MSVGIGIVGLSNSGRTTIFNALTKGKADIGSYTPEAPHIGIAKVSDHRLNTLDNIIKPKRVVPAEVKYIDIGASVLNVQNSVMDIRAVGREFGGKVAFRSDVDCQQILQHGTRQQVFDHVGEIIDCLGSYDGGLIGHGEVEPDMPLRNIRWMLEAFREIGTYS